jgi:hypothetical protein
MNTERDYRIAEVNDEISKWTVGTGIVLTALFPLSIPILLLTAAAVLPLALLAVPLVLVGALLAAPILLIRRLIRRPPRAARIPEVRKPAAQA